jgi:LPS export ABC transporter protein LptC
MRRNYWYGAGGAVLLVLLFYWLIEGGPPPAPRPILPVLPGAVVLNSTVSEEKDGKLSWELSADKTEIDERTGRGLFTGVKGRLFRDSGQAVEVQAGGGWYDMASKEVNLTGGVAAKFSEGWTITCQELLWSPALNVLIARSDVLVQKDALFLSAQELRSDRELTKITATGRGLLKKG